MTEAILELEDDALLGASEDERISIVRARADTTAEPGEHVGLLLEERFRVEQPLRTSRGALLYSGTCNVTRAPVLVRIYPSDAMHDGQDVERFLVRARAVARISSTFVALPRASGVLPSGDVYVVSYDVERRGLAARAIGRGGSSPDELLEVARALARALQAAHSAGVVHGDVRAEHVFVSGTPEATSYRLGGFATPDWAYDFLIEASTMRRRSGSASPVDETADVLGLGLTLTELMTGRFPTPRSAEGDTQRAPFCVRGVPFSVPAELPGPKGLAALVRACTDPDPRKRPESMTAVLVALDEIARDERRRKRAALSARTEGVRLVVGFVLIALIAVAALAAWIGARTT